ncbi:ornithine decarboxylase-like [Dermacentor variabilis]|uniref:ornithine decarboxylase-like n=1 Tax=Dermacentor variabilis TaxID=34621 RepID=UPI003F5C7CC5
MAASFRASPNTLKNIVRVSALPTSPWRQDRQAGTSCMEPHRLLKKLRPRNGPTSGAWRPTRQDQVSEAPGGGRRTSTLSSAPTHQNQENGTSIFSRGTAEEVAREIYQRQDEDDAFFVCDLRDIIRKVDLWRQCLPRVTPFYAIKACGDPVVLAELNARGVNFDCSNTPEILTMLEMGVHPDRIIYANTVKSTSHINFAVQNGVTLLTFDCAEELQKIKDKNVRLLLRIKGDTEGCKISFNEKYGCSVDEARRILEIARDLHCNVVGVCFHVGAFYQNPRIFARTIQMAKAVFDMASELGMPLTILNIGGGFPGGVRSIYMYKQVCESVRRATDQYFPASSGVQIIAEPGQFFVTSAYYLAVRVVGKRRKDIVVDSVVEAHQDVFLNESRDNCVSRHLYEFSDVNIVPLEEPRDRSLDVLTTLWGATCNPLDVIEPRKLFFDVNVDEWLLMDNMGAYTLSFACGFNGTGFPMVHYIVPPDAVSSVRQVIQHSTLRSGYSQPEKALKQDFLTSKRERIGDLSCNGR